AVFSQIQCAAKSKRSGERCRNYACRGRDTCRMHGGKSKRRKDHWNFRNALHNKDVREAGEMIGSVVRRPVGVCVVVHADCLEERVIKAGGERKQGNVVFTNEYGQLQMLEQHRVLPAAKWEVNAQFRELCQAVRNMERELMGEDRSQCLRDSSGVR